MALTDIVFDDNNSAAAARGNIGTLADILSRAGFSHRLSLVVPAIGDVKSGVQYGQQGNSLTGTYVGGGGGNTYSRGRIVNA